MEGDTFAAALEDATGRSDLLHSLHCPGEPAAPAAAGLGYFKVVDVQPRTGASLLIDCKHTAVMLEVRNTPSLASHAHESDYRETARVSSHWHCLHRTRPCHLDCCLWHQSDQRCFFVNGLTRSHAACPQARINMAMHCAQGSCCGALPVGVPGYRQAQLGLAPAAGRQLVEGLGDDPAAAWREPAHLPHAGALLPAWRRLAELLAPVLHPVRGMG